jgi:hypothetical protein
MSSYLGANSIYIASTGTTNTITTPLGTEIGLATTRAEILKSPEHRKEGINARLFFKLIDSKLKSLEQDKLTEHLTKLQELVGSTKELGQQALYEQLSEMIAVAARELEVLAVGIDCYIDRATVEKFRQVRREEGKPVVYFELWEKFPRVPPAEVADKIKRIRELMLFDEYWVLYLDYAREKKPLQTNKERIKNKDPILFGKFAYQPERLYFIVDWVDDFCDLTLTQFIEEVKKTDLGYEPGKLKVDDKMLCRIKNEVMERHERLKSTNSFNFRSQMAKEDELNKPKLSWWARLWRKKA